MERGGSDRVEMQSSENGTKVCGWMGYAVEDLRVWVVGTRGLEFRCGVTQSVISIYVWKNTPYIMRSIQGRFRMFPHVDRFPLDV